MIVGEEEKNTIQQKKIKSTKKKKDTRKKGQRYDWGKLKKQFFDSEHENLKTRIEQEIGWKRTTHIGKKTKGWTKEKSKFEKDAMLKAMEEAEAKLAKKFEPTAERMLSIKNRALALQEDILDQIEKEKGQSSIIGYTKVITEIVDNSRREMGEVHTITQSNVFVDDIEDEETDEETEAAVKEYLKKIGLKKDQ